MNYQIGAVWNRIIYVKGNFEYDSKQNNQLGCKVKQFRERLKIRKENNYTRSYFTYTDYWNGFSVVHFLIFSEETPYCNKRAPPVI